jgi:hypothetical protein
VRNSLQVREFVGKKKQVVRHVRNSLQVREVVGEVISPRGSPTTATELWEFLIWPIVEALEGKWSSRWTVE